MPFRLCISRDEVKYELTKMGYMNISEEMVDTFRKDLMKVLKRDLKNIKQLRNNDSGSSDCESQQWNKLEKVCFEPSSSTPTSYFELEKERVQEIQSSCSLNSEQYEIASRDTECEAAAVETSESSVLEADTRFHVVDKEREHVKLWRENVFTENRKMKDHLLTYPDNPDPVNLYHYYKCHWDKYRIPGEDSRSALRWEVRSRLFYST